MEIDFNAVYAFLMAWYGETLFFGLIIFTPLEWLFALRKDQKILRRQVYVDYAHLLLDNMLASVGILAGMAIIGALLQLLINESSANGYTQLGQTINWIHLAVDGLSYWQQCVLVIILSEISFYFAHRALHQIPWMWRFHSIHHSAENLDWLATYRAHPIDLVISRLPTLVIFSIINLHPDLKMWLTVLMVELGTFVHCNVRFRFGPLNYLLVTPEFHHWHHSAERAAYDKNFSSKFAFLDYLFGTAYFPKDRRADSYGITDPVPDTYLQQLIYPFRPRPKNSVTIFEGEARLLDELAANINSQRDAGGAASVARADLLSALIDAVAASAVDLTGVTSEEDVKARIVARLKRRPAPSGSSIRIPSE
jgi:sterol desaturase/sphingolipid hydroxylase (fatty acid hydroxylase superfamily)